MIGKICLCGGLRAEIGERRLDDELRGRRSRLLLGYLALNRARSVSRDELVAAAWPDGAPEHPDAALSTQLSRLRRALGPDILRGRTDLRLDLPPGVHVDVEEARSAVDHSRAALASGDAEAAARAARTALAIVERELLPGLEAPWIDDARHELDELRNDALESLARTAVTGVPTRDAERAARRLIELAPYRESGYLALMHSHAARGNRAEALQVYELVRVLLRDELGAAPGPELQELHAIFLRGDTLDHHDPPSPGEARRLPLPPVVSARAHDPFVGRESVLARLRDALERARSGEPQMMLVAGEPGMGKTRLATRCAIEFHEADATALYGGSGQETLIAYQPFVEALRHFVLVSDPGGLRRSVEPHLGAELTRLLPELRTRLRDLPNPRTGDPETLRYRLFEAVSTVLRRIAEVRPLLLVLDDLQWADGPSLSMLRHVVRAPDRGRLLVLGTYRTTELVPGGRLAELLIELRREQIAEEIVLDGLAAEETAALVAGATEADLPELADALHVQTGGNPFFIEEMIRHVAATGALARRAGKQASTLLAEAGVPTGVRDVIGRRLRALDDETQELLKAAAVIGEEFELDLLAEVSGRGPDELAQELEGAVRARIAAEVDEAVARYRFMHALTRATLYEELTRTRRARLHRRVGEALEALHADHIDPWLPALAHHFFSAGGSETTRAIDYARRAAVRATSVLAYEEAAEHYARALDAVAAGADVDDVERCDLLIALGAAHANAGARGQAREVFARAAEAARAIASPERFAQAALGFAGRGHGSTGVVDAEAVALLDEADRSLGAREPELSTRVLARLAVELYWSDESGRRRALSERAVEIARRLGQPRALAAALIAQTWANWGPDNAAERLHSTAEARKVAAADDDPELELEAWTWWLAALFEVGDFATADASLAEYSVHAERYGRAPYVVYDRVVRGSRALIRGHYEEVQRLAAELKAVGDRHEDPNTDAMFAAKQVWLGRELGGLEAFAPPVAAAAEATPTMPVWRAILTYIQIDTGRDDEAREQLRGLTATGFDGVPRDMFWLMTLGVFGEASARLGDLDSAATLYPLLEPFAERNVTATLDICIGSASRILGDLATVLGELGAAERHFEDALRHHAAWRAEPWTAYTKHGYAAMLARRGGEGDPARSALLLREAGEIAARLGMIRLAQRIDAADRPRR